MNITNTKQTVDGLYECDVCELGELGASVRVAGFKQKSH